MFYRVMAIPMTLSSFDRKYSINKDLITTRHGTGTDACATTPAGGSCAVAETGRDGAGVD